MDNLLAMGSFLNVESFFVLSFWLIDPGFWLNALQVAVGLGLVIFVHELGHFAVAKMCGVRCDKFYLGFDIGGWKIWKFKAGETEYGIGILPLGGYVKMLGQEDNPGRLKEEIQRAKEGQAPLDTPEGKEAEPLSDEQVKELEAALYDPRSYLAQNVPKRMAIISAGVIMNLIFAFVVAVIAYGIGVEQPACGIGSLHPGDAAWAAGLKPGDMIEEVNDQPTTQFRDLQSKVVLSDSDKKENGIPFLVKRPGVREPISVRVYPNLSRQMPSIGVTNVTSTSLLRYMKGIPPFEPFSVAAEAEPPLESGDKILEINGKKIKNNAWLHQELALQREKPLVVTVERVDPDWDPKQAKEGEEPKTITRKIKIPTQPLYGIGLVMKMGPIVAVQKGSTADKAGLRPDDFIKAVDGKENLDPMTLEDDLRELKDKTVTLTVNRKCTVKGGSILKKAGLESNDRIIAVDGKDLTPETLDQCLDNPDKKEGSFKLTVKRNGKEVEIPVTVKPDQSGSDARVKCRVNIPVTVGPDDTWNSPMLAFNNSPITIPELGVAIRVPSEVAGVLPDSPAAKAGVKAGQKIKTVTMIPPEEEDVEDRLSKEQLKSLTLEEKTLDFQADDDEDKISWPDLFALMQEIYPGTELKIEFADGEEVTLTPSKLAGRYNPDRGIIFDPIIITYKADSFGEALSLGADETLRQTTLIFRFLKALFAGDISPKNLAGPGMIVKMASIRAEQGLSAFLLFLTLLSANLAVVNFLPIPVLDGGHMVFLTYELIRRKPANEQVQIALSYIGLLLILALMIWVIGLDVMRFLS